MTLECLRDGTLGGTKAPRRRKNDAEAQWQRSNAKRRLKKLAAAEAAGRPFKIGRPHGPQKKRLKGAPRVRAQMLIRRLLCGKQAPMGMISVASTIHDAFRRAQQAAWHAKEQEVLAAAAPRHLKIDTRVCGGAGSQF